jgi:hypothetical protein
MPKTKAVEAQSLDLVDMPIGDLKSAVAKAIAALDAVRAALPNPTRMTSEERRVIGKLKNGESAILQAVADVAGQAAYSPLVGALGDSDFGDDPKVFEATLLKERLQRADVLAPLAMSLEELAQDVGDTVLDLQHLGSEPLRLAYKVLKSVATTDATLRGKIKDPIDFYASITRAGVKTRNGKNKTATTSPTPAK